MSPEVYNTLTTGLLLGSLAALVLSVAWLLAAIIGWKGPYRKQRLRWFAVFFILAPTSVGIQQLLLYQLFVPGLGRAIKQQMKATKDASSIVHVGDQAPSFTVTSTAGRDIDLSDLRGKVILINFFATWCGPCQLELPHVQHIWDELQKDDRFALMVIGREETTESIAEFQQKHPYTFEITPDPERRIYSLYAKEFIPRTYLVGADGKICFASTGFDEEEMSLLKAEIATQLRSIR